MAKQAIEFEQVIERGCGLDVHRDTVVATLMGKGMQTETWTFGTTTGSLKELGEWLESIQVTDGAMESTGIYWKPVLHVLIDYPLNLLLVNARHIKMYQDVRQTKPTASGYANCLQAGGSKAVSYHRKIFRHCATCNDTRKSGLGQ